jgi:hypothetical protein
VTRRDWDRSETERKMRARRLHLTRRFPSLAPEELGATREDRALCAQLDGVLTATGRDPRSVVSNLTLLRTVLRHRAAGESAQQIAESLRELSLDPSLEDSKLWNRFDPQDWHPPTR